MKLSIRRISFLLLALTAGASAAASAFANGGVSDGGGSEDRGSGRIVDSYLDSHLIDPNAQPYLGYDGERSISKALDGLGLMMDPALILSDIFSNKPFYLVKFDPELLQKLNEETRQKLIDAGFLRDTNQLAVQTPDFVLIDENYYDQQVKKIETGSKADKELALDNLETLWIHELVRGVEITTRKSPGETDEQALGKGSYHRYGMPPMTEANVLRLTAVVKDASGFKCSAPLSTRECDDLHAWELSQEFVRNNFGYFLNRDYLWQTFNPLVQAQDNKIRAACTAGNQAGVLDVLMDWQAIARNSMEYGNSGATRGPEMSMAIRVESFKVLNTYLGSTDVGALTRMEQSFSATTALADQICRAIRAEDLVKPRP